MIVYVIQKKWQTLKSAITSWAMTGVKLEHFIEF